MHTDQLVKKLAAWICGLLFVSMLVSTAVSCRSSRQRIAGQPIPLPSTDTAYGPYPQPRWQEATYASLEVPVPEVSGAEYVNDDSLCMTCHDTYVKTFHENIHRELSCEQCHGPASKHLSTRGKEPNTILSFRTITAPERSELCLKCHEQNACSSNKSWRTSPHAHHGVTCTDCHTSHYNVPPGTPATSLAQNDPAGEESHLVELAGAEEEAPVSLALIRSKSAHLGAITPHVCFRCHSNLAPQQHFAESHQICGATGLDCTTCHNPHGQIRPETRTDLCLKCHDNSSPTMAWHSSAHSQFGVACTDCHNPHPNQQVPQTLNIQHTNVRRAARSPMSVDDPTVCYKCHQDIYAKNAMPSHHPIKEGKIQCADCHDPHGQTQGNLKEPTVNLVCYRCHAEKQGPFAYEHPPVTENCAICHDPHGTVVNNLLRQPATFLCLRCHTGHRKGPNFHDSTYLQDIGTDPSLQAAFYTDCTQCHQHIHGSDVPSPHLPNAKLR